MRRDLVSFALKRLWSVVLLHYRLCTIVGILFVVLAATGIPRITIRTDPFRLFQERTPEFKDVEFVQKYLGPIKTVDLFVEAEENAFKRTETWRRIRRLEERIKEIPGVGATDSVLPVLRHLHGLITDSDTATERLFSKPGVIQELLLVTSLSTEGKRVLRMYLDETFSRMRLSIGIKHVGGHTIPDILRQVRQAAHSEIEGVGSFAVVGVLSTYALQVADLARSQTLSLILALFVITILMIMQFRSLTLGMLSLIPNFVPLAAILGVMGWLGIGLDVITVFAATVTIGLSVDDTIHFLTHLKRAIRASGDIGDLQDCMTNAYATTARALVSTSAVLLFAFITLVLSPFRPVASGGILLSVGVLAAIIGDLVFMPSVILSFPPVGNAIRDRIVRRADPA
jgi:predicted RND superfamily exporter protein